MKKFTMNRHIITLLLLLLTSQLSAVAYPQIDELFPRDTKNQTVLNKDVLESFIKSFSTPRTTDFDTIAQKVAEEASLIQTLKSVVNIQTIQLEAAKREKNSKILIS